MGRALKRNVVPKNLASIASLFLPIILISYSFLVINYSQISTAELIVCAAVSIIWASVSLLQIHPKQKVLSPNVRITLNHIFLFYFTVFILGFSPALVAAWLILFTETTIMFSKRAGLLSMATLCLAFIVRFIVKDFTSEQAVSIVIFFFILMFVCYFVLEIVMVFQDNQLRLQDSKKNINTQRERLVAIINNLTNAIISTDKDGVITVYNAAALNLLDTNESLIGRHINEVLAVTNLRKKPLNIFHQLQEASSVVVRDDLLYDLGGGDTIRLETTMSSIKTSYSNKRRAAINGYVIILQDITKSKSLEEEKDEFISVVSHELRTPVTIAEGSVDNLKIMLERGMINDHKFKSTLDTTHDQVVFLARMINDLSTLSRAERNVDLDVEDIEIKPLLEGMFNKYQPEAIKKNLDLNLDIMKDPGIVRTSRLYLEESLQNLITNAIKYTQEGSITISTKHTTRSVTIAVKDTGIGISKADRSRIFDKFYRSEDYRTRETSGTGLGLYVTIKLAKKMNAKLELESRLNHGSTFSLTIPKNSQHKSTD